MNTEFPHPPADIPNDAPAEGRVEVRIVSTDAVAARLVADALRLLFAGGEQRSYPAFPSGSGTRLHLTLDPARDAGPLLSWLEASRPLVDRTHPGETVRRVRTPDRPTPAGPPTLASPPPPRLQESS